MGPFWVRWIFNALAPIVLMGVLYTWQRRVRELSLGMKVVVATGVGGLVVLICGVYCMVWWAKPAQPFLWQPDVSLLCWRYCTTYLSGWGVATVLSSIAMIMGGLLLVRGWYRLGALLCLLTGLVNLPTGVLGLYAAFQGWRAHRTVRYGSTGDTRRMR